jgi:RND superfamily putative drug exporter
MFKFLGRFAASHPWLILALWGLAGLAVTLFAPRWEERAADDDIRFLPDRCASVRGYQLLQEAFPDDVFASRIVFAVERKDAPLSDADLALVDRMTADLERLRKEEPNLKIHRVYSHRDPCIGERLVSKDRHCTLLQVALQSPYLALQTRNTVDRADALLRRRLEEASDIRPGLALYASGPAGIGRDLINTGGNSLENTSLATVILVIVILLLVYRTPVLALVPLLTIAGAVWVALKILALCTLIPGFYLVNISQIFAVVMLYGAGTDYCLFLISRYREELSRGLPREEALATALERVGGALAASAGTTMCGLGLLALAEFAKVRSGGPAIAVSLVVALAAALTLAPALLQILGKVVFWPFGMPRVRTAEERQRATAGVWGWISKGVVARPGVVWAVSVAALLPLAWLGCRVQASYRATGELANTSSSVQGLAAIQRHFTAGEVGPITVLLESSTDWNSKEGREVLAHLSMGFGYLPHVAEVRSLTQPLGEPLSEPMPTPSRPAGLFGGLLKRVMKGVDEQVREKARQHYTVKLPGGTGVPPVGGKPRYVTRLDVVLDTDPFAPESIPGLRLVETWLYEQLPQTAGGLQDLRAETYGITVNARDLADVTESDRLRINALVIASIFLILVMVVRRQRHPWLLAAYLLGTVLFSYLAALGATSLVAHWWDARPLGEVDWRVPFFLFIILVAVGIDYNILLIDRALQERRRHGGVEGTRRALAHTGGTITSCGVIMAGTFATLMLGGLNTLVQIGFALAFGVLLDTFVVRPFLVPAFTAWLWRHDRAPRRRLRPLDRITLPFPEVRPLRKAG